MNYTEVAQQYKSAGYNLVPLQLNGTKQSVGTWGHLQDRFASDHELQEWFGNGSCGMGVVCGSISGNLLVIDFDGESETHFQRFWADAQQQCPGTIELVAVSATPRPGRQIWLRCQSQPQAGTALARNEQGQVLIETRATGNYVCCPGTALATHTNGTPYEFIHGKWESLPQLPDATVETLLAICRSYNRYTKEQPQTPAAERYQGEPRPGDIYNQCCDADQLMGMMVAAGWAEHHRDNEGIIYLTRPGEKQTPGHSAALHPAGDDGQPWLFVFSTNAEPFQANTAYRPYDCYTLLHHRADFGAAAAQVKVDYAAQVQAAQQQFHTRVQQQYQEKTGQLREYQPFPLDTLCAPAAAYVREYAAAIDIDAAYIAVPLLSVLAGSIGGSRKIRLKRKWEEPSILWTVTVGEPSSGKSPGWEAAIEPLRAVQKTLHLANEQARELYAAEQEAFKAKQTDIAPVKPSTRQLIIDDITMESLARVHLHNDKLLLACEELAGWVNSMDQYRGKGSDRQKWLSMYGGKGLTVNRATDDLHLFVPASSVSICGTIQPRVAADVLYPTAAQDDGLAYRVLAVQPPDYVMGWTDVEPSEQAIADMLALTSSIYELQQEPCGDGQRAYTLDCSPGARQLFIQFMRDTKATAESSTKAGRARWVKLRAVAARLALVLSVTRQMYEQPAAYAMQEISADDMRAGVELASWFGKEMERNWLAVSGAQDELLQHFDWICSKYPSGIDSRDFIAGRRTITTADDARRVFQQLVQQELGQVTDGRFIPSASAKFHPDI